MKNFAAVQQLKSLICSLRRLHMTIIIDMILWIGILILCFYLKNWTQLNAKKFIRNLNGTGSAEPNRNSFKSSFTYFDRLRFQLQIEKKKVPFAVTKMKTVRTGVFIYHPKKKQN